MNLIEWLRNWLFKLEKPAITGKISLPELNSLLKPLCKNVFISDNTFDLCTLDDAKKFLANDQTNAKKYISEKYDCDNFSRALWGYWQEWNSALPLGICWSKTHAFNIFIPASKKVYFIEPQTDAIIPLEAAREKKEYWPLSLIVV